MGKEYLNNKALEETITKFCESKRRMARYRMVIDDIERAIQTKQRRKKKPNSENERLQKI
jgi:hypothetical protein